MKCKHCEKCDKLILHSMLTFFISGTGVICETETRILEIELICLDNSFHYSFHILAYCSGESKGHAPPIGPNSFIFMQFSAQILQNNRLAPPGKPWTFHCTVFHTSKCSESFHGSSVTASLPITKFFVWILQPFLNFWEK